MFDVRACADQDEYGRAIGAIGQYFNPPPSEELLELFARTLPHERMHAAFEDDAIVGGAGAFPFELSVPGGSLPCAGVTGVGVHPTHRRRGVLRAMMDTQLRDIHERGEPTAAPPPRGSSSARRSARRRWRRRRSGASCLTSTGWGASRSRSRRRTIRSSCSSPRRGGRVTGWATASGCGSSTSPPRWRAAPTATVPRSCSRY